ASAARSGTNIPAAAATPAAAPTKLPTAATPAAAAPAKAAGAISGLDDPDSMLVSKKRAVAVASTSAAAAQFACPPGMMKVPGGPAAIGSDAKDDLRNFGDRALASVEIKPYCIDQFEYPNLPGKLPKVAAAFTE